MKIFTGKKPTWVMLAVLALISVIIGFIFPAGEEEQGFSWAGFNGFYALLGFIGSVGMTYLAKWVSHYFLERKSDYYD
jgi:hypothetical protein